MTTNIDAPAALLMILGAVIVLAACVLWAVVAELRTREGER